MPLKLVFAIVLLWSVAAAAQQRGAPPPSPQPAAPRPVTPPAPPSTPSTSQTAVPATDPWAKELAAFEAAEKMAPPARGGVVFTGSSTIQQWDVATHFPDLRILNRGLGGSELADVNRHIDRLVLRHAPRLVVLYGGDNDIAAGRLAEQVAVEFERFVRAVHAKLPQTRILFLAIKPSPLRWIQIDRVRTANEMIRRICERDDRLGFVDLGPVMLGWDGRPRRELYVEDGLHLSPQAYQLWSTIVRPWLTR